MSSANLIIRRDAMIGPSDPTFQGRSLEVRARVTMISLSAGSIGKSALGVEGTDRLRGVAVECL